MREPLPVACTISGGGRTVLNLLDRIDAGAPDAAVVKVVADRPCSGIARIEARGVPVELVAWDRAAGAEGYAARVWPRIEAAGAALVCNAGFLRLLLVPPAWEGRVLNIHPALLPRFGGKGMYGDHVHRAVLAAGEAESGCTVHVVTNEYDKGPIVLQRRVPVRPGDTVESLAARVFEAECEAYPEAVQMYALGRLSIEDGKVVIR
jgi:phosphoribosylglycinamide formyltransferase-1